MLAAPASCRPSLAVFLFVAAAGLVACGGPPAASAGQAVVVTDQDRRAPSAPAAAPAEAQRAEVAAPAPTATASAARSDAPVPALFDAAGQPLPAAYRQPAQPLRTQAGLYATRAQLEWQQLVAGWSTVLLDLDELGGEPHALVLAQRVQAFRPTAELAWFVKGSDGDAAVRVADQLTQQGMTPVFLVP